MRARDLDLRELLHFEPSGGVITFGGERVLLFDAVALGLLRKELIDTLGVAGARGVLTRFGYAHGRRTAESLRDAYEWADETEWRRAGGRLHTLQGLVVVTGSQYHAAPDGNPDPFCEAVWEDSYEAEQHLLQQGQSPSAACWTLAGFATGFLSFSHGREIYCVEERCRARGDAVCRLVGRFRENWGPTLDAHLPFYQTGHLDVALTRLTRELRRVEQRLRKQTTSRAPSTDHIVRAFGVLPQSAPMRRVLDLAQRVAKVDSTVLITGESGTGKERLARFVHEESSRAAGPFIAVNCGAVPEGLLESELFGHARGAFTGATQDRVGLFEAANGGTLFLDEIGEISRAMQVKLLRALQEREIRRVGENKSRSVNARILAATNADLAVDVKASKFRQDLYYRLRVVELRVPPLRERREDVLLLARAFLSEGAKRAGRGPMTLVARAAKELARYQWPGNVRELENAIERATALAVGPGIDVEDLPEDVSGASPGSRVPDEMRALTDVERDHILAALAAAGGNRAVAAARLGIGQATLYRKLKQYENAGRRPRTRIRG